MPEVLKNEERPQVIEATFSERQRLGERMVRFFEGRAYHFPARSEEITGSLAIRPAGVRPYSTAEASIDDSEPVYVLPITNSGHGLYLLESEPDILLNRALAGGDVIIEQ